MEAVRYIYTGKTTELFTKGKIYAKLLSLGTSTGQIFVMDDENDKSCLSPKFLVDYFQEVLPTEIGTPSWWGGKQDNPIRDCSLDQETLMELDKTESDPVSEYQLFPDETKTEDTTHKGLRFNNGKVRYDLLHPVATEGMARVMTRGALKYAERNWERGMKWSTVLASMKRHVAAFEKGVDYDSDVNCEGCKKSTKEAWVCTNHTGELHVDLIQTNAHFLSAYYKIYPQGDDRPHKYLNEPKIGLDIDEVLCDWIGDWTEKYNLDTPTSWWFDRDLMEKFEDLKSKGELDDFYLSLKPLINPKDIPFEPHCYITSRPVDSAITEKWLAMYGFPAKPVFTTTSELGKVEIAKREGVEIFVDDGYHNFTALNKAGICCFLMDAKHNRRYDVGYKRINNLKEL